jgi:hypothetical protein
MATICLFYDNNYVVGGLLGVILLGLVRLETQLIPALFISAALGTFGEIICCQVAKLWIYSNSTFMMIPWWIPVIWSILFASFFQLSRQILQIYSRISSPWFRNTLLSLCIFLIVIYTVFALIKINIKFSLFFAIMLVLTFSFRHDAFAFFLFLVSACCGTLGEYFCMLNDVWFYTDPNPMLQRYGIPLSLPLAWGLSMNIVWNLGGRFRKVQLT